MGKLFPVALRREPKSTIYSPEFQTDAEFAKSWRNILQSAHGQLVFHCCCPGRGEKKLAVRFYEETDSFGLARYPLSGEEHSRDCHYFQPDRSKSGMIAYGKGVVEERSEGRIRVRLAPGLLTAMSPPIVPMNGSTPEPGALQFMQMQGLLHLLWGEAGLNVWWPAMAGKRSLPRIHWFLNTAAGHLSVNFIPLDSILLVSALTASGKDALRNRQRFNQAVNHGKRLLVVALLATYSPERASACATRLSIVGFYGIPVLKMPEGLWEEVERAHPFAWDAWREGQRVIVMAEIEPCLEARGPAATVRALTLMVTNPQWIPLRNHAEAVVAERLASEDRAFLKPLWFDAGPDVFFPNFILLDTPADTPLEIAGEAGAIRQVAERQSYMKEHFGCSSWWSWHTAEACPQLPGNTEPSTVR